MNHKKLATVSTAAIALLLLTACEDGPNGEVVESEDNGAEEVEDENGDADEDDEPDADDDAEEDPDEDEEDNDESESSDRPTFGDTWAYDDGLEITISEPEEFEPGEWAAGGDGFDEHVRFEITIANNTGEDYDPNLISVTAHSSGAEGDSVFDTDAGIDGPPSTTLLDGQDTTFSYAFGVNDPTDITVEFTDLDFELMRDSVIWVSE